MKIPPAIGRLAVIMALLAPGWTRAGEPRVEFLDAPAAKAAIVDESMEPYFSLLQTAEMAAKTGQEITGGTLEKQRQETRRRYQANVLEFTEAEKETLRWYVAKLDPILREHYPAFARLPWRFIKVSNRIEGGLPHTRSDQIVLSPGVLTAMRTLREQGGGKLALAQFANLLIHEQMHVMQRLHPELFAQLYTDIWGFERAERIDLPESITTRIVVNPDGVDLGWVYPIREGEGVRYITPRLLWAQEAAGDVAQPRMPHDFRMIAVELVKTDEGYAAATDAAGNPILRPLEQERSYLPDLRREPIASLYHPNEVAADLFALMVMVEHLLPGELSAAARQRLEKNLGPTRRWFTQNLAAGQSQLHRTAVYPVSALTD